MTERELTSLLQPLVAFDIPVKLVGNADISGCAYTGGHAKAAAEAEHKYCRVDVAGDPADQHTLLVGLHEVGHTHYESSDPVTGRFGVWISADVLENEAQAWHYALDYCATHAITLTAACLARIRQSFHSYDRDLQPGENAGPHALRLLERFEDYHAD